MLHGEPEYRRRRREEAEQNQHYADREWDEATKKAQVEKIAVAIKGVDKALKRAEDEDENCPKNKSERRWKIGEISGLWAAAAVGLIAVIIGNIDASHQLGVMRQQLTEMHVQSAIQRSEIKAALTVSVRRELIREPDGPAVSISAVWTNIGKSDALKVKGWEDFMKVPMTNDRGGPRPLDRNRAELRETPTGCKSPCPWKGGSQTT
jgi:hypothetical protein